MRFRITNYTYIVCVATLIFVALFPRIATGQSTQKKPAWVDGYFEDLANSYIETATAVGSTEEEARNGAVRIIISKRVTSTGGRFDVQIVNGNIIVTGGGDLTVKSRILDEYRENYGYGQYRVSVLTQTAKNPTFDFERVRITDTYSFSARTLVPGMAQIHKGSSGKGVLFIVGEAALIGGVIAFDNMRASNESKIATALNDADRITFTDKASMMKNMRNGAIAGAALLYLWNVIDGATAKGVRHVQIGSFAEMKTTPVVMPYSGLGMSLTLNF